jgi:hypothetical protein
MADDMVEQRFQIFDPVRHAGDVGMDRNRHHPCIVGAFEIEAIELVGAALQELLGWQMLKRVDDDVVGLHRIGDGGDGAVRRRDVLRQIVDHPVGDIFDAVEAEQVQRFLGFGEARAFP